MIVAEVKSFGEIRDMLKDYKKVLIVGCGTCVTVCLSGGERQVELLALALRMARKVEGSEIIVGERTILRQCDPELIDQMKDEAFQYDAILSMSCGAGVQCISERFSIPVLPAMNTRFIGISDGPGIWVEMCVACGDCMLSLTGGICPIARCPKGLLNGPCGGTNDGKCEVSPEIPCAWVSIYEKLKKINRLDDFKRIIGPKDWSKAQSPGSFSVRSKDEK
ncbi:MAG: hypothetical protein DDT18_01605 [Actinobacteria bacterium]|nr:hypothetical protein [Actinomycetota bacterium]